MRCRYCEGELIHHYASAYKCASCSRVFEMFEEESFEDLKNQIEREREGGGIKMIPTRNAIAGEVIQLQRNFRVPMEEKYMKLFNSKQFVVKVARQLEQLYPEYEVTLAETEENYILRIK